MILSLLARNVRGSCIMYFMYHIISPMEEYMNIMYARMHVCVCV